MTVFIDDMYRYPMGQFGRMKMSHMIADDENELHWMADRIGVSRQWYQGDHYDISLHKRAFAIQSGAVPITLRQAAMMCAVRKSLGYLGLPENAEAVYKCHRHETELSL